MAIPWWLFHPVAVHFPIAFLTLGFLTFLWGRLRGGPAWSAAAATWLLWLGTLSAWAALGLGLLAEETAPHVPAAWRTIERHEALAFWTAGLFSALSVWRFLVVRRAQGVTPLARCLAHITARRRARAIFTPRVGAWALLERSVLTDERIFLAGWLIACALLSSTAYFGGELVYRHGMGVAR